MKNTATRDISLNLPLPLKLDQVRHSTKDYSNAFQQIEKKILFEDEEMELSPTPEDS